MASTTTQNYLGKCKEDGCDYVIFATREDVQDAESFRDVTAGAGVYRVGNNGCFARCTNRHKVFAVKAVKGTFSETHQCDSRCLNAKGWDCTCSCGGANHGRGHVATVTNAADIQSPTTDQFYNEMREARTPAPALKHVGIVDNTITGEVFVKTVKHLSNGKTLYSFRAVNGGHVIKWFVPAKYDPNFELGSTVKINAKVIRHDEFMGTPETVVLYVKEVE
jgi:hypothetical protein